jgi:hypothetical protein
VSRVYAGSSLIARVLWAHTYLIAVQSGHSADQFQLCSQAFASTRAQDQRCCAGAVRVLPFKSHCVRVLEHEHELQQARIVLLAQRKDLMVVRGVDWWTWLNVWNIYVHTQAWRSQQPDTPPMDEPALIKIGSWVRERYPCLGSRLSMGTGESGE